MVSAKPRRGDLWLVDFGKPVGHEPSGIRPALVVSVDLWNDGPSGMVLVVPTTTVGRGLRTQIEIDNESAGLNEVSYAKCEDVRPVSVERFVSALGAVAGVEMVQVERVLRFLMGL